MMKIFIVVPAYNEEERIADVLRQLQSTKLPIVVVDDGSTDATFDISHKSLFINHKSCVLRHKVNLGKGAALKTGCEAAFSLGADAVIMMDSDGQHKVEDLQRFVKALKDCEVVFGQRKFGKNVPLVRFAGNRFGSLLVSTLFGIYTPDILCGYRALSKKAFQLIDWQSTGYAVETEMVAMAGRHKLKYCQVPVQTVYYDKFKGVTILDSVSTLFDVLRWRILR